MNIHSMSKSLKKTLLFIFVPIIVLGFISYFYFSFLEKKGENGREYGGTVTYYTSEKQTCFFPLSANSVAEQRVLSQIYESLLRIDENNNLVGNLAKEFKISADYKTIELKIRADVYFHSDPCFGSRAQKMTIEDVKFSLEFACSSSPLNKLSHLLTNKIEGGTNFFQLSAAGFTKSGVSGIQIIDQQTLKIKLTDTYLGFLNLLSHPNLAIFSKKSFEYYGDEIVNHAVGTGAFCLGVRNVSSLSLVKNENYWKKDCFGNQLPFLDEIRVVYAKQASDEYNAFSKNKADILFQLPLDHLNDAFGSLSAAQKGENSLHKIIYKKGSKIHYLAFDCTTFPFNNENVRRAFNLAIDKKQICDEVLNGDGRAAIYGFVPNSNYYSQEINAGVEFNVNLAKSLLLKAGFDKRKPFPKLFLYVSSLKGSSTDKWCSALIAQLKTNLDVDLEIVYCTLKEKNKKINDKTAKIWKTGWEADYPDADSFLELFYSKNNYSKFLDKEYDSVFLKSQTQINKEDKKRMQQEADKILIERAAVIPIYSEDNFIILNLKVRDFNINNSGLIDFSKIYLKEVR